MNAMQWRYLVINLFLTLFLLGGCGGGGQDSAGVTVSAVITPTYNGENTSSVDVVQSICTSDTGSTQAEFFSDHGATASIRASLINPSNIIEQMNVYIDSYTINYQNHADSPGAPPIQSERRDKSFSFIVSGGTTSVSIPVVFIDLLRKDQYVNDVDGGGFSSGTAFINNYTATYTFEGHGENGAKFVFGAQTDFQIGGFNNCPSNFSAL